ncbi:MAG: twin-arginine translocation pathway signal protein [Pseudomonadota bacterium]
MTVSIKAALTALIGLSLAGCAEGDGRLAPAEDLPQAVYESSAQTSFAGLDLDPPVLTETEGFKLVPLGPDLTKIDYEAYMSSIEHLQATFTRSTGWPHAGLTMDDAVKDMETEAARFERRESFAYAVLTPDGSRERGCVYVYPGVGEYDAVVRLWVTKAEYDAGFDEELYAWTQEWIAQDWPFSNVAYPGRAIAWEEWDALTAKAEGV